MTDINFKQTTNNCLMKVWLDGSVLHFDEDGNADRAVDDGAHALAWYATGPKGATWKVEISAPAEDAWSQSGTLNAAGKSNGQHWF